MTQTQKEPNLHITKLCRPVNDSQTIWRTWDSGYGAECFVVLTEADDDQRRFMRDWDAWCIALHLPRVIFEEEGGEKDHVASN